MKISYIGMLGALIAAPLMADFDCAYYRQQNPLLYQREDDSFTLQFEGEFLYMRSENSQCDYIDTGLGVSSAGGNPPIEVPSYGTIYAPDWKYQPGFRVSAAAYFGRNNNFDVTARYLRFTTNVNGSYLGSDNPDLIPTSQQLGGFLVERNSNRLTFQSASISLDMPENIVDLVGGFSIDVTKNLYFRTFSGLSGFWVNPVVNVEFAFNNPIAASPAGDEIARTRSSTNGWGIGPIVGLDGTWSLTKNLGLFASFDFTVRYVSWELQVTQQETRLTAPGGTFNIVNAKKNNSQIGIQRSFLLGPQVDFWFYNDNCHLTLRGAWQWIYLDGAHQSFLGASVGEFYFQNLIQGLNASASLEF